MSNGYSSGYYRSDPAAENITRAAGIIGGFATDMMREKRLRAQDERSKEEHEIRKKEYEQIQQDREDYNEYYTNLKSNPHWRPIGKFNAKMFAAAEAAIIASKMQNVQFRTSVLQQNQAKIAEQHRVISTFINAAGVDLKSGNPDSAITNYEKAYEAHKDGADLIIGKDKKSYTVKMRNGSDISRTFNSKEEMLEHFRTEAEKMLPPENFSKTWIAELEERTNLNYKLSQEDKIYQNNEGLRGRAGQRVDPLTGKIKNVYELWTKAGVREVDEDEWRSLKMLSQEERKTEADIEYKAAGGLKREIETKQKAEKDKYPVNNRMVNKAEYDTLKQFAKDVSSQTMVEGITVDQVDRLKEMSKSSQFKTALKAARDNAAAMDKMKVLFEKMGLPLELLDSIDELISLFSTYKSHRKDAKR